MQRSLAGAAAAPLVANALGRDVDAFAQTVSPNDRIQVGLIGVGARTLSKDGLLDAAVAVPGVEVVGVCDAYKGRVTRAIENLRGRAKDYDDYRQRGHGPARSRGSSARAGRARPRLSLAPPPRIPIS